MPAFPSREPQKIRPRIDFDMEAFRKLVFAKGVDLQWEQCAECPCSRPASDFSLNLVQTATDHTGEARQDCTLCDGRGYFWHSPQTIRAIVTSASSNTERYALYGEYARGMVSVTTLPEHLPSYGDRFTLIDSVRVYRETRTRKGTIEALRYPIEARSLDLESGVSSVSVLYLQRAGIDGLTTAQDALVLGTDYQVTTDGKIDFTLGDQSGGAPALNSRYSISYFARPRYYVADHPHTHRDSVFIRKSTVEKPLLLPLQVNCSFEFMGS